jgi:alcohol dehydrogenase class IV
MQNIIENKLCNFIKKNNFKNILLISGKKSFNTSGFKDLKIFKNHHHIITIFYKRKAIPEINELKSLIKKINTVNPDLIIAVGGGSSIDYSKLGNAAYNIEGLEKKIVNKRINFNSKKTKLLAIPTTAGSGAEVTKFSVIYINKIKYSVENNLLKPDFYSLIPRLTISSSKKVRASSAFDAFAQAIESILSKSSNKKSLTYSMNSLNLLIKNISQFVNYPNYKNSYFMLKSANYSGKAINISKTNGPHSISYPFTSLYNLMHGHAVSINFSSFINFIYYKANYPKYNFYLNKKFKHIFKSTKTGSISNFTKFVHYLIKDMNLINNLKYGKIKKNIKSILDLVDSSRLSNCPVDVTRKELKNIIFESFNKQHKS